MKRFLIALTSLAVLVGSIAATATPAAARDGWRDDGWRYHHRGWRHRDRGWDGDDALAAGAIGLGVGALLGSALSSPGPRYYDDGPRYRYYEGPTYYRGPAYGADVVLEGPAYGGYYERPVRYREVPAYRSYRSGYGHVAACEARYRSYDRRTDTFVGYDGRVRRCRL